MNGWEDIVRIFNFAVCFFLALTLQAAEPARRDLGSIESGGVVPHIAVGGDTWSTDFDLVCLENSAQPFTNVASTRRRW